ncbi:MAG: hypothetical protein OEZ06_16105 [Myxococcales bacterium]|nr:hypothetical protein [Myxococcales bacterium]
MACTCADGSPGQASCQVDGTYGLCSNCGQATALGAGTTGSGAQAANAAGTEAGAAGAPAPTEAATMEATPSTMPSNEPVIVPPEDVAACNPLGQPPAAGEEVEVLEIRTSDVVAGGFASQGGTYYGCFWIEIDMPEKHHIIGWEGAIAGNPSIHHQQVSLGEKPFYLFNQGGLCGLPSVEFTWTGEKPTEWTPGMAGYPIGGPENGGKARFLWQVHFEGGATTYTGGFNAVITKNLRKYDAGNFEQGDVAGILVPAMSSTTHVATCTSEMTQQKLTHPIYVWSTLLHAHLFVDRIRSELYRGGQKIFTFDDWTTGPFGALADQQFKPLNPCVEILPGDEIVTTCDYTNTLATDVVGGEATNQEMCTNFMPYFPRLPNNSANFCGTIDSSGGGVAP